MAFAVVHFLSTDDVSVASSQWLNPDKTACMWPPFKEKTKIKRAVLEHKNPECTWIVHEVVVIGSYPNYLSAEIKCKKELDTSSVSAESDSTIARQEKNDLICDFSESSYDERNPKRAKVDPTIITLPLIDVSSIRSSVDKSDSSSTSETNEMKLVPFEGDVSFQTEPKECDKDILKKLDEILIVQRQHSLLLQRLAPSIKIPIEVDPSFMPKLPADTFSELDDFEAFLIDDSSFTSTVRFFAVKVSKDVASSTRRLLASIMTNKLAKNFNWSGTPPKRSFRDLKTVTLILCALKQNRPFEEVSLRDVETAIKDWLRHAPMRYNYSVMKKQK